MPADSGWTLETLHQWVKDLYEERDRRFEQRFLASQQALHESMDSARRAVEKAEAASERRFAAVNEFREQQQDLIREFARREEVALQIEGLTKLVNGHTEIDAANYAELGKRIEKVNDNVTRDQGAAAGIATQRHEARAGASQLIGVFVALLYVVSIVVAVLAAFRPH